MALIRAYREDDRDALRALVLALHEEVRPLDADLAPGETILDDHFDHLLRELAPSRGEIFLAYDGERLVGYACVFGLVVPAEVDEWPAPYTFLAELYVVPSHRALGVGGELIASAEDLAHRLGSPKLELKVHAGNTQAQRYYERLGFATRWLTMTKRYG